MNSSLPAFPPQTARANQQGWVCPLVSSQVTTDQHTPVTKQQAVVIREKQETGPIWATEPHGPTQLNPPLLLLVYEPDRRQQSDSHHQRYTERIFTILTLTHVAAPSTVTGQHRGAHHVRRVLSALPQCRPLRAAVAVVGAVARRVIDLVERGHTDPFRGRPFLPLDHLASAVEARRVCRGVRPKVEEQKGVPFPWFHRNAFLCTF